MIFDSRYQAGEILARKLQEFNLSSGDCLIAAIARGGVVVAQAISNNLSLPLTVVVIKKLGAPNNPELALGATASFGPPTLDRWLIADLKVSRHWLKKEIIKKRKEAGVREKYLGFLAANLDFRGKTIVVVDDGLATGQTARAASKVARELGAKKLILAVPCASPSAVESLKEDFDSIVCVEISPELEAVGQFYRDFRPVTDEEVKEILDRSSKIR